METAEISNENRPVQGVVIPGLSLAEYERLALLAEECGEVIQVIGKILRHGYESRHPDGGPTNRRLLEKEVGDVICSLDLLCGENTTPDLDSKRIEMARKEKHDKVGRYLHHQG